VTGVQTCALPIFKIDQSGEQQQLVAALNEAGFDAEVSEGPDDLPDGIVVRHGPDGAAAAALVVDAIELSPLELGLRVEQVDGITGRTVELSLRVAAQNPPVITALPTTSLPSTQPSVGQGEVAIEETTQADSAIELGDDGKMSPETMCG